MDTKKFNKIMRKTGIYGKVKMCDTLEEANFVLLYNTKDWINSGFLTKEEYIASNHSISDKFIVYYVTNNNPRDRRSFKLRLMQRAENLNV